MDGELKMGGMVPPYPLPFYSRRSGAMALAGVRVASSSSPPWVAEQAVASRPARQPAAGPPGPEARSTCVTRANGPCVSRNTRMQAGEKHDGPYVRRHSPARTHAHDCMVVDRSLSEQACARLENRLSFV
jgi:hypothetical protein